MVRAADGSVAFTGIVRTYDLLDTESWARSVARSPTLALAALRFTRKNAPFFAGYAVDAHHVPLAWTPPGRVFAELRLERTAVIEDGRISGAWGVWGDRVRGVDRFRALRAGTGPLDPLPGDVRSVLGGGGGGALALETGLGLVVVPAAWIVDGAAVYAALREEVLALTGVEVGGPAALGVDRPSSWRARAMVGAMIRGAGEVASGTQLSAGVGSFERIARSAGVDPAAGALVRVRPNSLVWWRGWTSGTVSAA